MSSALLWLGLLLAIFLGVFSNIFLFKLFKKNWLAFLLSLPFALLVLVILFLIAKLTIVTAKSFGGLLLLGFFLIGFIAVGLALFFAATIITSLVRWVLRIFAEKNKKDKANAKQEARAKKLKKKKIITQK